MILSIGVLCIVKSNQQLNNIVMVPKHLHIMHQEVTSQSLSFSFQMLSRKHHPNNNFPF